MKENIINGLKLFLKIIVVNIMCFFVVMSFSVLITAVSTKNIGYTAFGTTSDSSEVTELYTYYYEDGEDTKKAEYTEQGYTVTERSLRSQMSSGGTAAFLIISQIFCLLILFSFIYPNIWHIGTKDSNLVRFKHKKEDKLKGLKIGLVAAAPFYLFLILIAAAKFLMPSFPMVLYKFLNSAFYSFIDIICGTATAGSLAPWRLALLFVLPLIIPLISGVAYLLGYKNISVGEKFVYKKK